MMRTLQDSEQPIDEILRATRRAQDDPELFHIVHRDGDVRRILTNSCDNGLYLLLLNYYF
jgi:hypothetical protein